MIIRDVFLLIPVYNEQVLKTRLTLPKLCIEKASEIKRTFEEISELKSRVEDIENIIDNTNSEIFGLTSKIYFLLFYLCCLLDFKFYSDVEDRRQAQRLQMPH